MYNLEKIPSNYTFEEIANLFIYTFQKEFGLKKANEIEEKLNNSNRVREFYSEVVSKKIPPGSADYLTLVNSPFLFGFKKAEITCYAAIKLQYTLNKIIKNLNNYNEILENKKLLHIITKCQSQKITSNIFFENIFKLLRFYYPSKSFFYKLINNLSLELIMGIDLPDKNKSLIESNLFLIGFCNFLTKKNSKFETINEILLNEILEEVNNHLQYLEYFKGNELDKSTFVYSRISLYESEAKIISNFDKPFFQFGYYVLDTVFVNPFTSSPKKIKDQIIFDEFFYKSKEAFNRISQDISDSYKVSKIELESYDEAKLAQFEKNKERILKNMGEIKISDELRNSI